MSSNIRYSPSTLGFYLPSINSTVPDDAVEVSISDYKSLMKGQSQGKRITPNDEGYPTLSEVVVSDSEQAFIEHAWVKDELELCQVELMYYWTGDSERQTATEQGWKDYAISLRNYTSVVNGQPVVNTDTRPTKPV